MRRVLFVCSANYYRSRFAEHLFNWLARQSCLCWRAESRGLLVDYWGDVGAISRHVLDALRSRGIALNGDQRRPRQLTKADLNASDLVVAVKQAEHRPMMDAQFPEWADRVEYWHIDDLDCAGPEEAIPLLEESVRELIARLVNQA
jgi:protein-tyrosine phosphatase